MAPIVHGLEPEYSGKVNFVYLDIDDPANSDFKKDLGFKYQPHFVLIDGEGRILQQWLGPVSADEFRTAFDSYIQ
jgi:thioredoxin-like negative regulator of GroEL